MLSKALVTQGLGWALMRVQIVLQNKLGILERKTPLQSWSDLSLASLVKAGTPTEIEEYYQWRRQNPCTFFFAGFPPLDGQKFVGEGSIRITDRVLSGEFPFFGYTQKLGCPPAWRHNPLNGAISPGGHWSKLDEFESGDVKLVWEASRFGWAFALARAYTRNRDERYAEAFWQLLESWLEQNPPQWGINWKCGQEASFRVMALCFGFYTFANSPSSTATRVGRLVTAIAIHAKRINAHVKYARSQKNNHGISEGSGLWTIGLLFPELKGSAQWKARGKQAIESEVRRQIYADGSYVQHSVNYHRVMLHDLAWALRLGESNNERLSVFVYEGLRKGSRFLHALTDPETGWAPNYGANDGALVLPLSDCEYPDMRPVLQCCHFIAENERLYPSGPWDEEMVWLNGVESLVARQLPENGPPADLDAKAGGYHTIHSGDSWVMLRGTKYKDRPSQADQLHLDMWWRGENVLCDAGTYSYNSPAPFDHGFTLTRHHNTVTVDGVDQMTRLGRFLWADWANANVRRFESASTGLCGLEGTHDGYAKVGVVHCRSVAQVDVDTWVIVDDSAGRGEHNLRLHWLMPDVLFDVAAPGIVDLKFSAGNVHILLISSTESRVDLVRAGERVFGEDNDPPDPARGWISRYYARKEPALSLAMECCSSLPVRFITVVALGKVREVEVSSSLDNLEIDSRRIHLSTIGASPIFAPEKS
jgi:asparagine synthase (glutamine-hydrolysing)